NAPLMTNPRNGSSGTSHSHRATVPFNGCEPAAYGWVAAAASCRRGNIRTRSAFQQVDVLKIHGLTMTEECDDDREPHRGLRGRDGHHEEHEHLTTDAVRLGKRDEAQVDRVEHELHAH